MPAEMGKVAKPVCVCVCACVHGWLNGRVSTSVLTSLYYRFVKTQAKHTSRDRLIVAQKLFKLNRKLTAALQKPHSCSNALSFVL